MLLKRVMDDFTESSKSEIKIKGDKVTLYYYDKIKHFSSSSVVVLFGDKNVIIKGNFLVIEQMFKEYVTITGKVKQMEFLRDDEQ